MPSQFFGPLIAGVALALKVAAASEGASDLQASCATTINCETTWTETSTLPPQIFTTTLPPADPSTLTWTTTSTETTTTSAPGQPPAVTKTSTKTVPGKTTTETTTATTTETRTTLVPGVPPTSCPPTRTTETRTTTTTETQTPTGCPPCEPCAPCEDCPPCPTEPEYEDSEPEGGCTETVEDWKDLRLEWNSDFSKPGQPEPIMLSTSYDFPTTLEITDDLVSGEQYTVYLGTEKLGMTSEPDPATVGSDTCGQDAEKCIEEGYSYGSFQIPQGNQFISIMWEDADQEASFGSGQYRFSRETDCDEDDEDEEHRVWL